MTTKTKQKDGHDLRIIGFGPADLECHIKPGFNRVVARNGAGKTRALLALLWACGGDVPVCMRHGVERAFVEIDGERVRTLEKPMRNIGDVELALNAASPISDIICPDVVDEKRGEVRRIEALLRLVDVKVNDETIAVLVTNGSGEPDDGALDYLSDVEPDLDKCSITTAADRIRRRVHELKRSWEKRAENSQGQIDALRVPKPEKISNKTAAEAQAEYDQAVGDLREAKGSAAQRIERESERREIADTVGERPDVALFETRAAESKQAHDKASVEINELKALLFSKQNELTHLSKAANQADSEYHEIKRRAAEWDRRKAILDSDITGATMADVIAAEQRQLDLLSELDAARATEAWKQSSLKMREAQDARDGAIGRATHYEALAKGVTGRLSKLLSQAGLESLTVEDGKLCYVHQDGEIEPFVDLSWGERTKAVISLLLKRELPYNVLVLPRQFYDGLDEPARAEVGREFDKAGICVVLEEPGANEGLEVEAV